MIKLEDSELNAINGGARVGSCFRYTVKKGDILTSVANRYGTTIGTICEINCISDPGQIKEGTTILVPFNKASAADSI